MSPAELAARLDRFPRLPLDGSPTPLTPLPNLTRRLGGPALWIKRDDEIGPAMGGNKGRKLAYLLAEAQARRRRQIVTFGGLHSNHARMTAATCARLGLEAHLFFFEPRPAGLRRGEVSGNPLLNELLGARSHFIPMGGGGGLRLEQAIRLVGWLSWLLVGPRRYFIPVGGHNVTGCLGYVAAALELQRQIEQAGLRRVTVVVAAGTGGTLAGLLAGFTILESPVRLLGLDIGKLWPGFAPSLARLTGDLCAALGSPRKFSPAAIPLRCDDTVVGPGYARLTEGAREAIALMAQTEGILLDPVYTGKAFAGLLAQLRQGAFDAEETVIFLHSGGAPSLWAFAEALAPVAK